MDIVKNLPESLPELYSPSIDHKIVGVAKKYLQRLSWPEVGKLSREGEEHEMTLVIPPGKGARLMPHTVSEKGAPHEYEMMPTTFWTAGFFPGSLWLLRERNKLTGKPTYSEDELTTHARGWQEGMEADAYPAENHDQGFRFMPSFYKDYVFTGNEHAKEVTLLAVKSLAERYNEKVGCTRSWDGCKTARHEFPRNSPDTQFLVIVDNMMNLDLLYTATQLTGDPKYAKMATSHAEVTAKSHIRPDFGTFHVVNFDPLTGEKKQAFAHQGKKGWKDDSTWSRGQAWGIYGYADCAKFTGRADFLETSCKLADRFLSLLTEDGVPYWDFDHPRPTAKDASAGMITACGLLKLFRLLSLPTQYGLPAECQDKARAEGYLGRAFKLIKDTVAMCLTPAAKPAADGTIDFGEGGWECILRHSTANGHEYATTIHMDHGLVYADMYFIEFGNEALKLQSDVKAGLFT